MKTLRKFEASGPEFKVANLQNDIFPKKNLKYMLQRHVGLNDWVCQKPAW